MKKLIITILAALPYFGFAQAFDFTIKAKVASATPANEARLIFYKNGDPVYATAKLENGEYTFKGTAPGHLRASFFLDNRGLGFPDGKLPDALDLRLEEGIIHIVAADSVKNAKVTGGPYTSDFIAYKNFIAKEASLFERTRRDQVVGFQDKKPQAELDQLHAKVSAAYDSWSKRNIAYAKAYPRSYSSIDALSNSVTPENGITVIKPIFDAMSTELKKTAAAKALSIMLTAVRETKVGAMAPLFTLADTTGKPVSLKAFRGKYVFLDFWASWCHPCREEHPNYITNYKKYKGKGLEILGVTLDKPKEKAKWIEAIQKDGLLWSQVGNLTIGNLDVSKLYNITSIPQNYLLDPEGKIIASNLRGEELGKKLAEILDK